MQPNPIEVFNRFRLIGFAGEMGSGKTESAKILEKYGFSRLRFAKYLKSMLRAAGLTESQVDGTIAQKDEAFCFTALGSKQELAEKMIEALGIDVKDLGAITLLNNWTVANVIGLMIDVGIFGDENGMTTPRKVMQLLGTEWGRAIHKDFWTNLWLKDYITLNDMGKKVVCDDVRFPNEVTIISMLGGVTIRLYLPKKDEVVTDKHASELGVEGDCVVYNMMDGVESLEGCIREALHRIF